MARRCGRRRAAGFAQAGKPVDQIAASQGALMGKLITIRANARAQMRGVLTPAQIQKLEDLRNSKTQGGQAG